VARRWEPRSVDPSSSAVRQLGDELYNLRIRAGLTRSAANRSHFLRATLWTGLGAVLESLRLTLHVEGPGGGPATDEQLELAVRHYARAYWATPAAVLSSRSASAASSSAPCSSSRRRGGSGTCA
jgi:hypothetical protein